MNPGKAPVCKPTWRGHVETTKDALLVFEACFNGTLAHCFRRPHDRERNSLIVSGNVFVYEEGTSGIKRWTDGIPWSPSRILTNFLIYRQLNSPFPPGEKKRATKRSQRPVRPGEPYAAPVTGVKMEGSAYHTDISSGSSNVKPDDGTEKDIERTLVGSLVDSYDFKDSGLLKKTMTVIVNNVQHHLVSYYSLDDAKYHLKTPREDPRLKDQNLREELLHQPRFKFPNFDDAGDGLLEQLEATANPYSYLPQISTIPPCINGQSGHVSHQDQSPPSYYPAVGNFATQPTTASPFSQYPMSLVSPLSQASFSPTPTAYSPPRSSQFQWPPPVSKAQRTLSLPAQNPVPRYQPLSHYMPPSSLVSTCQTHCLPTISTTSNLPRPDSMSSLSIPSTDYSPYHGYYTPTANVPASMAELPLPHPPQWHNPFQSSYAAHTDLPAYAYRAAS